MACAVGPEPFKLRYVTGLSMMIQRFAVKAPPGRILWVYRNTGHQINTEYTRKWMMLGCGAT